MKNNKFSKLLFILALFTIFNPYLMNSAIAKDVSKEDSKEEKAMEYRRMGYEAQKLGDLDAAMSFYQQALGFKPDYAVAYNDVGVLYEMQGGLELAEQNYLKALQIDANYLPAYTNMAFLYEKKADFAIAADYWMKRVSLGAPGEYWTEQARDNFKSLADLSYDAKKKYLRFQADNLSKEVTEQKISDFQKSVIKSKEYFDKGKELFDKGDYVSSAAMLKVALILNPDSPDIATLHTKAYKEAVKQKINECSTRGLQLYESGDNQAARREFRNILTIIPAE